MQKTRSGLDHLLLQQNKFQHYRIALVTNNWAYTLDNEQGRTALIKKGLPICKLFSPEHGLMALGEDGTLQNNHIDNLTKLPVISLYGNKFMLSAEELDDIDLVLFDIPDIGCRFYTYLWTMTYVMEACALHNKPLVILDRPNPIGGNMKKAEGPLLDESNCASFLGRWSIPVRHCCTFGELANYFSATRKMDIDLKVIQLFDWSRHQPVFNNVNIFKPTSPAISTIETAICYPGTGLLEGINVNEGRGSKNPFTIFGAPWINNYLLHENLDKLKLPGVQFSEIEYSPSGSMYAGESCFGLSLAVIDEDEFLPVHTGLSIIHQLLVTFPENCNKRLYKTAANPSGEKHLDKLTGIENSFSKLKEGVVISTKPGNEWFNKIDPYLLYH